jgi:crotonobetainyl-CoA:carnitine CoA-transferase CaiB-like acyl-CoA transferase
MKQVFEDPQVESLQIARKVAHPRLGDIDLIAQPCEITGFDRSIRSATPDFGADTHDILRSLGCDDPTIETLRLRNVI